MRRARLLSVVLLLAAQQVAVAQNNSSAKSNDQTAADLVARALASELEGPSPMRKQLLDEALKHDPDYAPARWHSGYVRYDNQWLTVDEVARRASADPKLAAYREQRNGMVDTAENHRELALWCRKNKLNDEERLHWMKVLAYDNTDQQAIESLKLEWFQGQLVTHEQAVAAKNQFADQAAALRAWQPKAVKWQKAIANGSTKQHDEAIAQLKSVDDPAAIPALAAALAVAGDSPKVREQHAVLIETLDRMKSPLATEVLLSMALFAPVEETRDLAIEGLKHRPYYAYVPLLLAMWPDEKLPEVQVFASESTTYAGAIGMQTASIEVRVGKKSYVYFGNSVVWNESQAGPSPIADQVASAVAANNRALPTQMTVVNGLRTDVPMQFNQNRNRTQLIAAPAPLTGPARIQQQVAALIGSLALLAERKSEFDSRVRYILVGVTGEQALETPKEWEQWWISFTDSPREPSWKISESEETFYDSESQFVYVPGLPADTVSQPEVRAPLPSASTMGGQATVRVGRAPLTAGVSMAMECFTAGTLVATLTGLMPIEDIKPGDRVLAADAQTGAIEFRSVYRATLSSPSDVIAIGMPGKPLHATKGHPLWVIGRGWTLAKHLQVGDVLHGLNGAVPIEYLEAKRPEPGYNLIVPGAHAFFVGQQRLLVHDNTPLAELNLDVPGLSHREQPVDGQAPNQDVLR